MNRSFYLQIFVFAFIVAFVGSLNVYAQKVDAGEGFYYNTNPLHQPSGSSGQIPYETDVLATTITHSATQTITPLNSVSCNAAGLHADNSYWRAFNLNSFGITGAFNVTNVSIGIETCTGGSNGKQLVTVNLYTSSTPFPTGYPGSLTLIGTADIYVPDQDSTVFNIPVFGTAPAGSELVVEIFTPDGQAVGNSFFIGSNPDGETGPSYLSAAACGITAPTPTGSIGFPGMMIVMNVTGDEGAAVGPGSATAPSPANGALDVLVGSSLNWTNPGGTLTNVEVFFGTDLASLTSVYNGAPTTSYTPPSDLAYSTDYWWQIYVTDASGVSQGNIWSFKTEAQCVPVPLPVVEDFEGAFPPLCWTQSSFLWFKFGSLVPNGFSAVADFWTYSTGTDDLITLEYISTGASNPRLTFDWAYATCGNSPDELDIFYSTDSGASWLLLLAMPGGTYGPLNPFNIDDCTTYYVPDASEWSTMSLTLPPGTTNIKFTAISAYGNLLWLDNVKISGELYTDSFENPPYVFPGQVALQNPTEWTTWTGTPGGADDATISTNYAYDGVQSALIDYSVPRWVDLVKPLGNKTSGTWYISFFNYIPTGKTGYFNTLAVPPLPDPPGPDWAMEVYFDVGGGGRLMNVPGAPINFTWNEDTWNQVLVVVDFTQTPTTGEFWFGKVGQLAQLQTWDWTQGGTITDQLGGNDFFAPTGTTDDEMYIDAYYFSDVAPPIVQLADDAGVASIDMDYQYGPGSITPLATVKNYGTADHSFDVLMTINPGGYSQTVTTPVVLSGDTYQATFPNWTETTVGPYTVDVTTQLVGDGNSDNDNLSQGVHIWDDSGDWTLGSNYPITTYNGAGVNYNDGTDDWLFVIGGNTTSGLRTECYKYNVTTDTWSQIASLPSGRLILSAEAIGDYIYAIGGSDGTVYTNTTYKYDIAGNTWSLLTAVVPTNIGWCRSVSYMDQYIYLAGGYDGVGPNYQNTVFLFDAITETWSTASPMPLGVFGGGFGITGNTLVYAAGAYETGIDNTVMVGTIDGGNPALINWVVAANPYPGNGKEVSGRYGGNLLAETQMQTQSAGAVNHHLLEAAVFPAGAIYRTHAHTWGSDAIIMSGGTPTSNYVAADPDPCYIYKPGTDTWIAQENAPVPVGAHQSGTFSDGSIWKYIVASGFGVDSTESETQIYTQTLGGSTFAFSISVLDGWNMVSAPGLHPTNQDVTTWWPGLTGQVFEFNGAYSPVTTTTPSVGYWMKNVGPQTYNFAGIQIVTHNSINAAAGWNLIGGYETTVPTATLTTTPPNLINTPVFEYNGAYQNAINIVPGYGYWVKMDAAGLINAPPLAKGSVDPIEYFKEDWGKIILTDATGISYTLYAVNGQVDLNKYELPPAPPSGVMDIRYGSGRIAEDLTSSQSIELNSVQYPVSVRVENMTLTLQDPSGVAVNASINPGETVRISDNSINKLIVLSDGLGLPIEYALEQNYPNPFNPSTTIKFALPEAADVTLNIYNTLGEKIAQIVNSKLEAGRYSYQWDAGNIATGMYIYELRTDKFVSVKKMILLK